jgi:hypothetical protein
VTGALGAVMVMFLVVKGHSFEEIPW